MRALTFSEFKETCPAKEDCVKECKISNAMCQVLYREAIGPNLAKQMRDEESERGKHRKGT